MIRGTVALPVWNSKPIAWLCMESLCRQLPPTDEWELIVFEERHPEQLGESFFRSYESRLKKVGNARLSYLTCDDKHSLSEKWITIARYSSIPSVYFCLCAADNYYDPHMLQDAERNIDEDDWCVTPKGYFYDLILDKVARYDAMLMVGLQMTARTDMVAQFPWEKINKRVDMWFSEKMSLKGSIMTGNHWEGILCTQGLNNISKERHQLIVDCHPPFYETKKKLHNIIPEDIANRLKTLSRCLKSL